MPHFCDPFICCPCLYDDDAKIGREINRKINQEMKKSKQNAQAEIKMLLLGTGEAGKSTVIKQMRIIHGKEFEDENIRLGFVQSVRENVIESIQILLNNMERFKIPLSNPNNQQHRERILTDGKKHYSPSLIPDLFASVSELWKDEGVRKCYRIRAEFKFVYLSDSSKYFLDQVATIGRSDYVPTEQDILRVRKSSTGVQEYSFTVKSTDFRVVDVGGQRSERRKWIHCFENVTAMIFVASLSDYDQVLLDKTATFEDDKAVNRMQESLALFSVVIQDRFLATAAIILFLNKTDIFAEKLHERNLEDYFPEYSSYRMVGRRGSNTSLVGPKKDVESAQQFVLDKYMEIGKKVVEGMPILNDLQQPGKPRNQQPGQLHSMYPHFTCATDTQTFQFVSKAVEDLLLRTALVDFNLV